MTEPTNDPVEDIVETAPPDVEPTPAVDDAAPSADSAADDAAVVAEPAGNPSIPEAEAMFKENPGLACVLTDSGVLNRDGILTPVALEA